MRKRLYSSAGSAVSAVKRRFMPSSELIGIIGAGRHLTWGCRRLQVAENEELIATGKTSGGGNAANEAGYLTVSQGVVGPDYGKYVVLIDKDKLRQKGRIMPQQDGSSDVLVQGPISIADSPIYTTQEEIEKALKEKNADDPFNKKESDTISFLKRSGRR
jgi:hypothetical protein